MNCLSCAQAPRERCRYGSHGLQSMGTGPHGPQHRVATARPDVAFFRLMSPAGARLLSLLTSPVGCLLILMMGICLCSGGQRGVPPQEGIVNFGKINDNLYRGAQP